MDWVTFIIIWLFQSAVRLVLTILRHVLVHEGRVYGKVMKEISAFYYVVEGLK